MERHPRRFHGWRLPGNPWRLPRSQNTRCEVRPLVCSDRRRWNRTDGGYYEAGGWFLTYIMIYFANDRLCTYHPLEQRTGNGLKLFPRRLEH